MHDWWRFRNYLSALFKYHRHLDGLKREGKRWQSHYPTPIPDLGETGFLSILPLVDWHASAPGFKTEMGVSYLVKTDHLTVLFDVGQNAKKEDPSPLLHNMAKLGVDLASVDVIVISHRHYDHTGGHVWSSRKTFSLGNRQIDLSKKKIVVPCSMTYPGAEPIVAVDAMKLSPGVATTGIIGRQLFIGWVDEQALAVNVKNKGIVLIVGCGHQKLDRLLQRTERLFSLPIYGIIGGLHYPLPKGRVTWLGINTQRRFASGGGLLTPLSRIEIEADLSLLRLRRDKLGAIGLSGHDSSDEVIEWFRQSFGPAYQNVRVGEEIVIS